VAGRERGPVTPKRDMLYDQPVAEKADSDDATAPLSHLLRVYPIGPEGMIRNVYNPGFLDPRPVLNDVRTLQMETKRRPSRAAGD
jgi:hypothetical protein